MGAEAEPQGGEAHEKGGGESTWWILSILYTPGVICISTRWGMGRMRTEVQAREREGTLAALRADPLEGILMCWEQHLAGGRGKLCDIGLAKGPLWVSVSLA